MKTYIDTLGNTIMVNLDVACYILFQHKNGSWVTPVVHFPNGDVVLLKAQPNENVARLYVLTGEVEE